MPFFSPAVAASPSVEGVTSFDITTGMIAEYAPTTVGTGASLNWPATTRSPNNTTLVETNASVVTLPANNYYLDQSDDWLADLPHRSIFEGRNEWTMHFWVKWDTGGSTGTYGAKFFTAKPNGSGSIDFRLVRVSPLAMQFAYSLDDGFTYYLTFYDGAGYEPQSWQHVTWVHQNPGTSRVYVDGVLRASQANTSGVNYASWPADGTANVSKFNNIYNSNWADGEQNLGYVGAWDYAFTLQDHLDLIVDLDSTFGTTTP